VDGVTGLQRALFLLSQEVFQARSSRAKRSTAALDPLILLEVSQSVQRHL
jgi:hypothetical protein